MNKQHKIARLTGMNVADATAFVKLGENRTKHNFETDDPSCTVCGGVYAALPEDCPGRVLTAVEAVKIFRGLINFRQGKWQDEARPVVMDLMLPRFPKVKVPENQKEIMDKVLSLKNSPDELRDYLKSLKGIYK